MLHEASARTTPDSRGAHSDFAPGHYSENRPIGASDRPATHDMSSLLLAARPPVSRPSPHGGISREVSVNTEKGHEVRLMDAG